MRWNIPPLGWGSWDPTSNMTTELNSWHHVALVQDQTNLYTFKD